MHYFALIIFVGSTTTNAIRTEDDDMTPGHELGQPGLEQLCRNNESAAYETPLCGAIRTVPMSMIETGCRERTPWKNIKYGPHMLSWIFPSKELTANHLWQEVVERVEDPVAHIRQRTEGLCGPASVIFLIAVLHPVEYMWAMYSLYCLGEFKLSNKYKMVTTESWPTIKGETTSLLKKPIHEDGIQFADWVFMASMRNFMRDWEERPATAVTKHQSTIDRYLMEWITNAFPGSTKVLDCKDKDEWGISITNPREAMTGDHFTDVFLPAEADDTIFQLGIYNPREGEFVPPPPQSYEPFRCTPRKVNHAVVLVGAMQAHNQLRCAVWSWGHIYTDTCQNFRKIVKSAWKIVPHFDKHPDGVQRLAELKKKAKQLMNRMELEPIQGGEEFY